MPSTQTAQPPVAATPSRPNVVTTKRPHSIDLVLREHEHGNDRNLSETLDRLIQLAAERLEVDRRTALNAN